MISLLKKDFYNLRSYLKTILILVVFFTLLGFLKIEMYDSSFLSGMLIIIFTMIPIASFTYDLQSKWDAFCQTLPVTRKEIVLGKYILSLLTIGIGFVLSFIMNIVYSLWMKEPVDISMIISSNGMVSAVGIIILSIILPLIYKFGVEKGRIILIIVCLAPTFLFMSLGEGVMGKLAQWDWQVISYASPVFALGIMFLSYNISYKIYNAKDF